MRERESSCVCTWVCMWASSNLIYSGYTYLNGSSVFYTAYKNPVRSRKLQENCVRQENSNLIPYLEKKKQFRPACFVPLLG